MKYQLLFKREIKISIGEVEQSKTEVYLYKTYRGGRTPIFCKGVMHGGKVVHKQKINLCELIPIWSGLN
jgi:hypothetical protein